MAVRDFELYHGAVLTKILKKNVATSLKLVETMEDACVNDII